MTTALQGIKVLEMTRFIAGPYAGSVLASLGADVIKIEPPDGDVVRSFGPMKAGVGLPFEMMNHNKKGLVIDLKKPGGREVIYRMVKDADIVLESSRPGTAERLGVSYERLSEINPRLIYCSISGFGQDGPYRGLGGVDIVAQAMGGLMGITGEPGGEPVKVSQPIADYGCGMWAVIGILAALAARQHTGRGQRVDSALLDTPIAWSLWEASRYFGLGEVPEPLGSSHRNVAPYRAFLCADGRHVVIGAASQALWEKLCEALDVQALLAEERFSSPPLRVRHRAALEAELKPLFRRRTSEAWLSVLNAASVPCGLVKRYDEAVDDPQVKRRKMVADVHHSKAGPLSILDVPVYLSDTPRVPVSQAPGLGEHSTEVLEGWGFRDDEIQALLAGNVVV
ncbi:CaiB/BaiF CoA transferase family protein [Castellaniella sp.]|uniref:CaiB/BaiF CoA transferase family protein n=1 Tax=Castellaniella sp. TaxID=1955812 RepID=UPI003C791003